MSESEDKKTATGIVEEVLPDSLFRVRLSGGANGSGEADSADEETPSEEGPAGETPQGELVLAYLAGKMRLHRIRVLVGDQVEMVIDPYGGRARIVRRLT
jgi:translation initiation factor IF-1